MIIEIKHSDSVQHPCVWEDDQAEVYVEDSAIGWVVHCYVQEWSKSVYWKLVDIMILLQKQAPRNELYCVAFNEKLLKFAQMFGFESIDTLTDTSTGKQGELMVYA